MTDDVKPDVIKLTQTTLGSFIKKPVLSEKHLKKPPFRFLHDIVTSVIRETGFLSGLYTVLELQSENIKDRDMKIAFLQKLIDCITIVTGKTITARPSKIVAGLEPTKTNELLQAIGYALKKKLDSSDAVAQIEGGTAVAPVKKKSRIKDDKKPESKVKQSPTSNKGTDKVSKSSRVKESPKTKNDKVKETVGKKEKVSSRKADNGAESKSKVTKGESPRNITKKSPRDVKKKVMESPTAIKEANVVPKSVVKEQKSLQIESPPPELNKIDTVSSNIEPEESIREPISREVKISVIEMESKETGKVEEKLEVDRPKDSGLIKDKAAVEKSTSEEHEMSHSSVKTDAKEDDVIMMPKEPVKMEHLVRPKTSLRPPSVRPSSARPAAPRLKDRYEVILPPDEVINMGKVNVIVENFTVHEEEDNEETVVVEEPPELTFQPPPTATITELPAEKGLLVGQILEQLGDSVTTELKPRVEIEWEAGGKKNREVARKEMDRLCDSIQTLTRAANPLGKLMNFLQEDMDSMRSELKMWLEINEKLAGEIKTQKRLNEDSIEPLKKQLTRMDAEIGKQREQIAMTHANILRNEHKIKTLITRNE